MRARVKKAKTNIPQPCQPITPFINPLPLSSALSCAAIDRPRPLVSNEFCPWNQTLVIYQTMEEDATVSFALLDTLEESNKSQLAVDKGQHFNMGHRRFNLGRCLGLDSCLSLSQDGDLDQATSFP